MEFLRFGSSIPGTYWGCCAADIIQNFKVDPDTKVAIQIVDGDGGMPVGDRFAGPTYLDIFGQRLQYGTFGTQDMPNHAFFAILTEWQINSSIGKKWLAELKKAGFEFIRTVNNSVYSGQHLGSPTAVNQTNDNHIFALIRNIGSGGLKDPFTPPKAWTDLPSVKTEAYTFITDGVGLAKKQHEEDTAIWKARPEKTFLTRKQAEKAGCVVYLAGKRSPNPQEPAANREKREAKAAEKTPQPITSAASPF